MIVFDHEPKVPSTSSQVTTSWRALLTRRDPCFRDKFDLFVDEMESTWIWKTWPQRRKKEGKKDKRMIGCADGSLVQENVVERKRNRGNQTTNFKLVWTKFLPSIVSSFGPESCKNLWTSFLQSGIISFHLSDGIETDKGPYYLSAVPQVLSVNSDTRRRTVWRKTKQDRFLGCWTE